MRDSSHHENNPRPLRSERALSRPRTGHNVRTPPHLAPSYILANAPSSNGTTAFQCLGAAAGKDFCAAASLTSNIIIRCSGVSYDPLAVAMLSSTLTAAQTVGQPGNCNDK